MADWTNSKAVIAYTEKQLQDQYNLIIKLPQNRLCPPLPNRLNYINWLNSILSVYKSDNQSQSSTKSQLSCDDIKVLDIGTGASIIYPILGYKHYNWYFLGSEIDTDSYSTACENVKRNETRLYGHIEVVQVESSESWQNTLAHHIIKPWLHKYHMLDQVKSSKNRKKHGEAPIIETNPYLSHKNTINTLNIMNDAVGHSNNIVRNSNSNGISNDTAHAYDSMEIDSNSTSHELNNTSRSCSTVVATAVLADDASDDDDDDDDEPSLNARSESSSSVDATTQFETISSFMHSHSTNNQSSQPIINTCMGEQSVTSSSDMMREHNRGPIMHALLQTPSIQPIVLAAEESFYSTPYSSQSRSFQTKTDLLLHFTMCNPPFYDLKEEIERNEKTANSGSDNELRTTGGEVAFVCAMIADSLILNTRILWYTSLVGKKSSLRLLLAILRHEGITNVRSTRLTQGKTMRWCVAWSFTSIGEQNITDADKVFAWNRLRNKIYKDQHQSGSISTTSSSLSLNPRTRMGADILTQVNNTLQLQQVSRSIDFVNIQQILSTCTVDEIKQFPQVFRQYSSVGNQVSTAVSCVNFMHVLTILEDRVTAAIHSMNTAEKSDEPSTNPVVTSIVGESQLQIRNYYYTIKPFQTSHSSYAKDITVDNQKKRNRNDDEMNDSNNDSSGMSIDNEVTNSGSVTSDDDIIMVRSATCEILDHPNNANHNVTIISDRGVVLLAKCKTTIICRKLPKAVSSSALSSLSNEPRTSQEYHYSTLFEMKDVYHNNNDVMHKQFNAILDRLHNDITRTNRRWRRLLAKIY